MITAGVILVLLASIIRGWGALNHRRGPMEAALIASGSLLAIFSILSILLGLVGADHPKLERSKTKSGKS